MSGAARSYLAAALPARRDPVGGTVHDRWQWHRPADAAQLAAYVRVSGGTLRDVLPPLHPGVAGFATQLDLLTDPAFPFRLPGLVHVSSRWVRRAHLPSTSPLDVHVRAAAPVPHRRGRTVDVITSVTRSDARGPEADWELVNTYLHRERSAEPEHQRSASDRPSTRGPLRAVWRLPADAGRRYAAVSGDVNPIHLHPWAAKAFGFDRTVAHGMWTAARVLAGVESRLPEHVTAEIDFVSPVLLPSTVHLVGGPTDDGWDLTLVRAGSGRDLVRVRIRT